MQKRLTCTISGRIQGVLYRDFARRVAMRLALVGTVQNLPQGTVCVIAEGEEKKLHQFVKFLSKGPPLARVDNVLVKWDEATGEFSDFRIVYTNFLDRL